MSDINEFMRYFHDKYAHTLSITARHGGDQFFTRSAPWVELRGFILNYRGARCSLCKNGECALEVHHIQHRKVRPDLAFVPENLEVLCQRCHAAKHSVPDKFLVRQSGVNPIGFHMEGSVLHITTMKPLPVLTDTLRGV